MKTTVNLSPEGLQKLLATAVAGRTAALTQGTSKLSRP